MMHRIRISQVEKQGILELRRMHATQFQQELVQAVETHLVDVVAWMNKQAGPGAIALNAGWKEADASCSPFPEVEKLLNDYMAEGKINHSHFNSIVRECIRRYVVENGICTLEAFKDLSEGDRTLSDRTPVEIAAASEEVKISHELALTEEARCIADWLIRQLTLQQKQYVLAKLSLQMALDLNNWPDNERLAKANSPS